MGFKDRSDGVYLKRLSGFRKMFPFLMATRTESLVYHMKRVRIDGTLAFLERANATQGTKWTLFTVVLAAGVRTLATHPDANRFVSGWRIYQRKTIDVSFVVKRDLAGESGEANVKLTFQPRDTLADVAERTWSAVQAVRKSTTSHDEGICDTLTSLPRPVTRLALWGLRLLDNHGLLPASFVRGNPLYTSAYVANLGSLGLEAVYHHLFEWGNASCFVVMGKKKKAPMVDEQGQLEVRDVMDIKFTLDERITDGAGYAKIIGLLAHLVENPEELLIPPENLPDPYAFA